VVCGVSGGADSLALLVLAVAADLDVTAVHVDHGLRPTSSTEADVVAAAAERFGARFRSERVDLVDGPDLEQRARLARRKVLGPGALTGHTADDQAETLLINLLRGTGLTGLGAIRPGPTHPIVALRRADTVAFCDELQLDPVDDESNTDRRFVRNRVRHELLPVLADIAQRDPVPLLCRTADVARQAADGLDQLAAGLDPTDSRDLQQQPDVLVRVALRDWLRDDLGHPPSSAELERVVDVVHHDAAACELSGGRRVERTGGRLRISTDEDPPERGPA
jgi:tRNA(Ile)-lysidine synthase